MTITSRILTAAAVSGALLGAAAPAHALDGLNLVNAEHTPASALLASATGNKTKQIRGPEPAAAQGPLGLGSLVGPLLHPNSLYDNQNNGFVIESLERNIN